MVEAKLPDPVELAQEEDRILCKQRIQESIIDARAMTCAGEIHDDPFGWTNFSDPAKAKVITGLLIQGRLDAAAAERLVDPAGQWTKWATDFNEKLGYTGFEMDARYRGATLWQAMTPVMRQGVYTEVKTRLESFTISAHNKWMSAEEIAEAEHPNLWVCSIIESARRFLGGVSRPEEGRALVANFRREPHETLIATFERFKRANCLRWQSQDFPPQPTEQRMMLQKFLSVFDTRTEMFLITEGWSKQSTWAGARVVVDQVMVQLPNFGRITKPLPSVEPTVAAVQAPPQPAQV